MNVYVPTGDGSLSEVDLVMVSETGVYVFESKNYSGWIFGNESQRQWTQMFKNKQKFRFYNPIWQNNTHIDALHGYLGQDNRDIFKSYITFSERCELKDVTVKSAGIRVIKRENLRSILVRDMSEAPLALRRVEIDSIAKSLQAHVRVSQAIKDAHIKRVKAAQYNRRPKPAKKATVKTGVTVKTGSRCPRCKAGNLVLRKATNGDNKGNQFYGCDSYPKCRFIQNV